MRSPRRFTMALLCALAAVAGAGCFRSPDMAKLSCTTSVHCPSGFQCVVPTGQLTGLCQKSVDAGTPDGVATPDVTTSIDSTQTADLLATLDVGKPILDGPASGIDTAEVMDLHLPFDTASAPDAPLDAPIGPDIGPGTVPDVPVPPDSPNAPLDVATDPARDLTPDLAPDLAPDLPPKKPLGASCTLASECADNFCAGGVCCDRSCAGACEECTAASGGRCTFKSGKVCNAASDCMNAAICPGTSATCPARPPKDAGTLCGSVTCSGNTQSASTCDGAGNCGARGSTDCWPFKCVSGAGCKTSCTASTDCVSEGPVFCGANGQCRTQSECWRDLTTNLLWQADPDPKYYQLADAKALCANLALCGFDDWVLPDIDQLRSLIRGCPNTQTGGACGITTSCLDDACESTCMPCEEMMGPYSGCYSDPGLGGPCSLYWSSSTYYSESRGTTRARFIGFTGGSINPGDTTDGGYVRCVRR